MEIQTPSKVSFAVGLNDSDSDSDGEIFIGAVTTKEQEIRQKVENIISANRRHTVVFQRKTYLDDSEDEDEIDISMNPSSEKLTTEELEEIYLAASWQYELSSSFEENAEASILADQNEMELSLEAERKQFLAEQANAQTLYEEMEEFENKLSQEMAMVADQQQEEELQEDLAFATFVEDSQRIQKEQDEDMTPTEWEKEVEHDQLEAVAPVDTLTIEHCELMDEIDNYYAQMAEEIETFIINSAASKLQSIFRMYKQRKIFSGILKSLKKQKEEISCATKIQSFWRGFVVRRDLTDFQIEKSFLDSQISFVPSELEQAPVELNTHIQNEEALVEEEKNTETSPETQVEIILETVDKTVTIEDVIVEEAEIASRPAVDQLDVSGFAHEAIVEASVDVDELLETVAETKKIEEEKAASQVIVKEAEVEEQDENDEFEEESPNFDVSFNTFGSTKTLARFIQAAKESKSLSPDPIVSPQTRLEIPSISSLIESHPEDEVTAMSVEFDQALTLPSVACTQEISKTQDFASFLQQVMKEEEEQEEKQQQQQQQQQHCEDDVMDVVVLAIEPTTTVPIANVEETKVTIVNEEVTENVAEEGLEVPTVLLEPTVQEEEIQELIECVEDVTEEAETRVEEPVFENPANEDNEEIATDSVSDESLEPITSVVIPEEKPMPESVSVELKEFSETFEARSSRVSLHIVNAESTITVPDPKIAEAQRKAALLKKVILAQTRIRMFLARKQLKKLRANHIQIDTWTAMGPFLEAEKLAIEIQKSTTRLQMSSAATPSKTVSKHVSTVNNIIARKGIVNKHADEVVQKMDAKSKTLQRKIVTSSKPTKEKEEFSSFMQSKKSNLQKLATEHGKLHKQLEDLNKENVENVQAPSTPKLATPKAPLIKMLSQTTTPLKSTPKAASVSQSQLPSSTTPSSTTRIVSSVTTKSGVPLKSQLKPPASASHGFFKATSVLKKI